LYVLTVVQVRGEGKARCMAGKREHRMVDGYRFLLRLRVTRSWSTYLLFVLALDACCSTSSPIRRKPGRQKVRRDFFLENKPALADL
jgi:hypothetical protein